MLTISRVITLPTVNILNFIVGAERGA